SRAVPRRPRAALLRVSGAAADRRHRAAAAGGRHVQRGDGERAHRAARRSLRGTRCAAHDADSRTALRGRTRPDHPRRAARERHPRGAHQAGTSPDRGGRDFRAVVMAAPRKGKPQPIGDALTNYLDQSGLAKRVEQAGIIPAWERIVGEQIASVTAPQMISRDGTLFVAVRTNSWMQELSLLEPQILRMLNAHAGELTIARIHWRLMR